MDTTKKTWIIHKDCSRAHNGIVPIWSPVSTLHLALLTIASNVAHVAVSYKRKYSQISGSRPGSPADTILEGCAVLQPLCAQV